MTIVANSRKVILSLFIVAFDLWINCISGVLLHEAQNYNFIVRLILFLFASTSKTFTRTFWFKCTTSFGSLM